MPACLLLLFAPAGARADPASKFASGTGNILYLAAAIGLPLVRDGSSGKGHTVRVVDSLATSLLVAEALKVTVREERPDHSDHDSFPSGHATAAFAAATMESAWHPREAPLWYTGATLIGVSRVTLHRHYIHDVIAGALLGYGTARLELASRHGLVLSPLIGPKHLFGFSLSAPIK